MARIFVAIYQTKTTEYYYSHQPKIKLKPLGILAAIIAFPFIILLMLIDFVVPQKQWEEFWDDFL